MDSFIKTLELLLPQFFEGSYELFHDETKNLNHVRRTKHKDPVRIDYIISSKEYSLLNLRKNMQEMKINAFFDIL